MSEEPITHLQALQESVTSLLDVVEEIAHDMGHAKKSARPWAASVSEVFDYHRHNLRRATSAFDGCSEVPPAEPEATS